MLYYPHYTTSGLPVPRQLLVCKQPGGTPSIILFDHATVNIWENDFFSSPDYLLDPTLHYCRVSTNFTIAIEQAKSVMERHWSTERCVDYPSTVL